MLYYILICYAVGSLVGFYSGYGFGFKRGTQKTLDTLIENKFLRTRYSPTGMEIVKYYDR